MYTLYLDKWQTNVYKDFMTETPLTFPRRVLLLGLYNLLEQAPGNGACIHRTKQYLTVLRLRIAMGVDISASYETEIRKVIRRLYPLDNAPIHSNLLE